MSCSFYKDGKCKSGFPVTTGCWATGKLEESMMAYVRCIDEEWAGEPYNQSPDLTPDKDPAQVS